MGPGRAVAIVALVCLAAASAHALSDEEERAKAHFLAGQSYYDQASYADALREFAEAYRISQRPALLYNIARCHEALERWDDAIAMLERYLAAAPDAPDRPAIEARIAHLNARKAEALRRPRRPTEPRAPSRPPAPAPATAAEAATSSAAAAAPPPPAPRHRRWAWIVGGLGLGALAAAVGTGAASQNAYNDLSSRCPDGRCDPAVVSGAQARIDRGHALALATDVLWPVGAAALAAGVVLVFVEGRAAPRRRARLAPFVGPTGGGLAVARDF